MQRTHIWAQHVTLVTELNSFPPKADCCLCARKHTNMTRCRPWGSGSVKARGSVYQRTTKPLKRHGWLHRRRPGIRSRNTPSHQREDAALKASKCASFSSLTRSSTAPPFVMSLASSISTQGGVFLHAPKKRGYFAACAVSRW